MYAVEMNIIFVIDNDNKNCYHLQIISKDIIHAKFQVIYHCSEPLGN